MNPMHSGALALGGPQPNSSSVQGGPLSAKAAPEPNPYRLNLRCRGSYERSPTGLTIQPRVFPRPLLGISAERSLNEITVLDGFATISVLFARMMREFRYRRVKGLGLTDCGDGMDEEGIAVRFSPVPQLHIPWPDPSTSAKLHTLIRTAASTSSNGTDVASVTEVLVTKLKLGGRLLAIVSAWLSQTFNPSEPLCAPEPASTAPTQSLGGALLPITLMVPSDNLAPLISGLLVKLLIVDRVSSPSGLTGQLQHSCIS